MIMDDRLDSRLLESQPQHMIMDDRLDSRLLESQPQPQELDNTNTTTIWTSLNKETKLIWTIAFPSMLCRLSQFGVIVVTQSFIGHISQLQLAAYALVLAVTVQFVNGILLGMSSATETLCGQAFGARHYHMMGIYLQRSWLVDAATATLLLPFFICATPIFKLLGEEEDISNAAETISFWFIGVLYSSVFSMTMQMFLQAQQRNMFIGIMSVVSFVLHVILSWIFVNIFSWGVPGAMCAMILSRWSFTFFGFIYIFGGWCRETWGGFSKSAFADIIPMLKLSLTSGVMICVLLWYSSVLVLLAGYTKNATVNISAFSICINITSWMYTIFLGFMIAASVRVSNEVGRGNVMAAKFAIKVILSTATAIGLFFGIIILVFGREIPYLFTSDNEIAEAAADLSVFVAIALLLNCSQAVFSGVAIGTGSQAKVAIVNVFSYYVVGIPLGCVLAYVVDLQVKGIWIGMMCGSLLQVIVLGYLTWRIDWIGEVNRASHRLNRFFVEYEHNNNNNVEE